MKTQVSKPITPAQIKKIHVLLTQKGLIEEKKNLVHAVSCGRVESTKELTFTEANYFRGYLTNDDKEIANKKQVIYRSIWNIAWQMGVIYGDTEDDYQMNRAKLNIFCRQRGTIKKNLSDMDYMELKKTHRQFEAMFKKHLNGKLIKIK